MSVPKINIYACGPTVYDEAHLGHARTYIMVDLIHRVISQIENKPTHLVINITDIDDKIINKAIATQTDWKEISKTYEKSFFNSMQKINVNYPHVIIRVSEIIPEIVDYIQVIISKGFAYVTSDGSVYFDTEYYQKQGYELSQNTEDTENAHSCIDNAHSCIDNAHSCIDNAHNNIDNAHSCIDSAMLTSKKNIKDFALWKSRSQEEIGFDATFEYLDNIISVRGRPGWHIECSAMIHQEIGSELDIHLGGIDLKFPHHQNEMMQANAYYHPQFLSTYHSAQWVKQFMHVGHLCIKGLKMSKSLKNFTTIDEILKKINANQLRWLFITHKWTDPMDFDDETINQAMTTDETIINFFNRIVNFPFDRSDCKFNEIENVLSDYYHVIKNNITDQLIYLRFDKAANLLLELVTKVHTYLSKGKANEYLVRSISTWIHQLLKTLGFDYENNTFVIDIKNVMNVIVETRTSLRQLTRDKSLCKEIKQKIFEILDAERNTSLKDIGIILQDTKDSSNWFQN